MTNQNRITELENELNLMKEQLYRLCACLYPQALGEDELEYIATGKRKGGKECTDPIIKAIQENNAKYNERPNIDFSRMSSNCVTCDHFGKCEGCKKREEE